MTNVDQILALVRADLRAEVIMAEEDEQIDVFQLAARYTPEWLEALTDE